MKILYGTTNKAKLQTMEATVKSLGIELISLNDLQGELPYINENGNSPLENAEIKARAYYDAFRMPVFSCDSGLYFDELKEEEQPGIHVRRVHGKELTDDEIYKQAKQTIFIVDNYIGLKTREKLINIKSEVNISIYSDNLAKGLRQNTYMDFCKEYPELKIRLFYSGQ